MADIAEASQKKLKTRISKFRKCNKDEQEKEKFFNKLGISFTINVPDENSENEKMKNTFILMKKTLVKKAFQMKS